MFSFLITLIMSIVSIAYAYFAYNEKGPLLTNFYFYASKTERERLDKKKEYKSLSIIYLLLGIALMFLSISMIFNIVLFNILYYLFLVLTVASSIKYASWHYKN